MTDSPPPGTPSESAEPTPAREPISLSLWHLFAMMAAIAVAIIVVGWLRPPYGDNFGRLLNDMIFRIAVGSIAGGIAIGVIERFRGKSFPSEPGHGLMGLTFALTIALWAMMKSEFPDRESIRACSGVIQIILGVVAITCAYFLSPNIAWRGFFALFAVYYADQASVRLLNFEFIPSSLLLFLGWETATYVAAAAITVILIADFWRTPRPDWLHWTGAATTIVILLERHGIL